MRPVRAVLFCLILDSIVSVLRFAGEHDADWDWCSASSALFNLRSSASSADPLASAAERDGWSADTAD